MGTFVLGVDLGQAQDYTALALVERLLLDVDGDEVDPSWQRPSSRFGAQGPSADAFTTQLHLRHLERPALRTSYEAITARVRSLLATPPLTGRTAVVVDHTGVGRPVVDSLRGSGLRLTAVTITSGDATRQEGDDWHVPKRDLVAALQLALQNGVLRVAAGLPLADTLVRELLAFRVTLSAATGHDSYAAWREADHDDLVLAAALAVWWAVRPAGSIAWV